MKPNELIAKIENGELDKSFKKIYVSDSAVEAQKPRYIRTIKEFINLFGDDRDVFVLSAPGRTEVCGNHTIITARCLQLQSILTLLRLRLKETI